MGIYNCARCDLWAFSEDNPPIFDERLPADSTCLLCEDCTGKLETADLDEALDNLFGPDMKVRMA